MPDARPASDVRRRRSAHRGRNWPSVLLGMDLHQWQTPPHSVSTQSSLAPLPPAASAATAAGSSAGSSISGGAATVRGGAIGVGAGGVGTAAVGSESQQAHQSHQAQQRGGAENAGGKAGGGAESQADGRHRPLQALRLHVRELPRSCCSVPATLAAFLACAATCALPLAQSRARYCTWQCNAVLVRSALTAPPFIAVPAIRPPFLFLTFLPGSHVFSSPQLRILAACALGSGAAAGIAVSIMDPKTFSSLSFAAMPLPPMPLPPCPFPHAPSPMPLPPMPLPPCPFPHAPSPMPLPPMPLPPMPLPPCPFPPCPFPHAPFPHAPPPHAPSPHAPSPHAPSPMPLPPMPLPPMPLPPCPFPPCPFPPCPFPPCPFPPCPFPHTHPSSLSFAATDYMTPFIRHSPSPPALSFAATDYMTPFIRLLDPETSHQLAVLSGEWGLTPRDYRPDPPSLATTVWGRRFSNPVGMAAGFDKDAHCVDSMFALGLGFTEIGSVTPLPQPGNPKPRCFRLTEQKAVINRYGFNSAGIADVAERLGAWQARRQQRAAGGQAAKKENVVEERVREGVLAVNLGKNKTSEDAAGDYVKGVHALGQFADVLVVNVSSPNTPGLRKLQGRSQLQELLQRVSGLGRRKARGEWAGWVGVGRERVGVQAARNEMEWGKEGPPPLLLKIAPDLTTEDMSDIAAVALSLKIDGLAVQEASLFLSPPSPFPPPTPILLPLPCEEQVRAGGSWAHQHPPTPTNTHQHPPTPSNTHQHPPTPTNTFQHPPTPSTISRPGSIVGLVVSNTTISRPDSILGLVVSNTTISRPDSILGLVNADEVGGLSGKPLFELSTAVLRQMYSLTKGQIPIIGCGGIYRPHSVSTQSSLAPLPPAASAATAAGSSAGSSISGGAATVRGGAIGVGAGGVGTAAVGSESQQAHQSHQAQQRGGAENAGGKAGGGAESQADGRHRPLQALRLHVRELPRSCCSVPATLAAFLACAATCALPLAQSRARYCTWQCNAVLVRSALTAPPFIAVPAIRPPFLFLTFLPGSHVFSSPQLRILAACALGSGAAAGIAVSIMDPKTFSALSFAATDYMTPFIRLLDPETSHQLAVLSGEWGLTPRDYRPDPPSLATTVWGRRFSNPVGMAAGFDKDAHCVDSMFALGLGFTEIGSVTPLPQPGNPKPRCFRLTEQKAVINRYGFNSAGIADVAERLGAWQARRQQRAAGGQAAKKENVVEERVREGVLAVNLGKNKTSEDAAGDYVKGVHALGQFADVLVVNVSSPNTPGLRKLQGRSQLQELLQRVQAARNEMEWGKEGPPPLLLKIAPDLTTEDMSDIAAVALSLKIDGLVVSNTTISRPDSILGLVNADEVGGLSGKPLFELSTAVLRQMYSLTKGQIPIIGCGGIYRYSLPSSLS
ncbi:unnamed protein product [Closterium sp. Naga37s-1]|nr:unnamed protein product [Closterium sp. Naga37s-1]